MNCLVKKKKLISNSIEEGLQEKQQPEESEDNVNQQQRYGPRKQLTCNRNMHDTDSSLDKNSYKEILNMNTEEGLEERCSYLDPTKAKNTNKIWWS